MSLAVLLVSGPSLPRVTYLSQAWVHDLTLRVAGYFDEQSGGRVALEWRVFDWFRVPVTDQQWDAAGWDLGDLVRPLAEQHHGIDLSGYTHLAMVIDQWNSRLGAWHPEGKPYLHISAQDLTPALYAHEVGHMLGSRHARASDPSGVLNEYGDSFCVMGAEGAKASFVDPEHDFRLEIGQPDWRFCEMCHGMYFDGHPGANGTCPGAAIPGTGHRPAGYQFVLPHDRPAGPDEQVDWRYCQKCFLLFFDGYAENGQCPSGGAHEAAGYTFVLPHDVPPGPGQADWRYCQKCFALFFDGFPDKGDCAGGGGHEAAGFNFAVPHDINPLNAAGPGMVASNLCGCGWLDVTRNGVDVSSLAQRPSEAVARLHALRGAPPAGSGQPVVAWADGLHGERVLIEYRVRDGWDRALGDSLPGFGGWILVHLASGPAGSTNSTIVRAFPAEVEGTAYVDEASLRITVTERDDVAGTVALRLDSRPPLDGSTQANWRFCRFCQSLYYDGFYGKGRCPAGGQHAAIGWNFMLAHDIDLPSAQRAWRFCAQCNVLFFDGFPTKGTCPAGAGHSAAGFDFALVHDTPGAGQPSWRFCDRCFSLFYDGSAAKGSCPAGGGHRAAGYDFSLRSL